MTSDHSPLIVTLSTQIIKKERPLSLYNKKTNWNLFQEIITEQISCNISCNIFKTEKNLETAIDNFNTIIQKAAWEATPAMETLETRTACSISVKDKRKKETQKEMAKNTFPA